MTTKKHPKIDHTVATRTLAPEELHARRQRKAFVTPVDLPQERIEPARTVRRTVDHPGIHPAKIRSSEPSDSKGRNLSALNRIL